MEDMGEQNDGLSTERKFLESQTKRLVALRERENARRSKQQSEKDSEPAGAAALEQRWTTWKQQLAQLEQEGTDSEMLPTREEQRRQLQLQFNKLKDMLNEQRRQVVWSNDTLSDTNLRRWHSALVAGQGQLDNLQAKFLPKRKFVFRRYRQQLEIQRATDIASESDTHNARKESSPAAKTENDTDQELVETNDNDLVHTLQDYTEGTIIIDGTNISIQTKTHGRENIVDNATAVPLVWRRLQKCTVHWTTAEKASVMHKGSVLHLVGLTDCTLYLDVTLNAIHVSECSSTEIHAAGVQQVRLHTSTNVKVWGTVTGGTILEDCQRIGVTTTCPNVQDFSWLKAGKPSPNLERLSQEGHSHSDRDVVGVVKVSLPTPGPSAESGSHQSVDDKTEEGSESDEI